MVMLSAPVSIEPKPEVIEPEFRAPVPVMAVLTLQKIFFTDGGKALVEKNFKKILGVKSLFSNFLVKNTEKTFGFEDIQNQYELGLDTRLDLLFTGQKNHDNYSLARQYLFDFFTVYFFDPIHSSIKNSYEQKYQHPCTKHCHPRGASSFLF